MERQQMIILFFSMVMSSSAAEVKNLSATEGGNITLPDAVWEMAFLIYGVDNLAMVTQSKMQVFEPISKNKIHWNNITNLFTITDLQKNDAGIYTINSKKGQVFTTSYQLTVYERVPAPAVRTLSVNPESCSLLCSVDKAEETTLLWYKDEEVVNQSSSAHSLPLTVHKQDFNSSYRCAAANKIQEKTFSVDIKLICGQKDLKKTKRHSIALIVVPVMLAVTVLLVAVIAKQKYLRKKWTVGQTQEGPEDPERRDVLYTDVCIYRQCQQPEDIRGSPGPADSSSQLKTIYDKVEVHRMAPEYTEP